MRRDIKPSNLLLTSGRRPPSGGAVGGRSSLGSSRDMGGGGSRSSSGSGGGAAALKISDFGVSGQLSASVSRCASWVGTVTYMSPERIRGDTYSFNTDIWVSGGWGQWGWGGVGRESQSAWRRAAVRQAYACLCE